MNNRKNTRSQVWPDTKATIRVREAYGSDSRGHLTVTGIVKNLGSNGLFIETNEMVPVPERADIIIDFNPESNSPGFKIQATGETVHKSTGGIGIRFITIDLNKLQKCIITKMNKLEQESKYKLTGD
jgi:hypothetical protein